MTFDHRGFRDRSATNVVLISSALVRDRLIIKSRRFLFVNKLWCRVGLGVKHENSISNELMTVQIVTERRFVSTVIYLVTVALGKKIYSGETGRKLANRFHEHLREGEKMRNMFRNKFRAISTLQTTPTTT